jgi:hypothetical protein
VGFGPGISIADIQSTLDTLFTKASRKASGSASIVSVFSNSHLYPTGVIGAGLTTPSNIWRNNFGLQKSLICFGPVSDLTNPAFVMQDRVLCPYLDAPVPPGGDLSGRSCSFRTQAHYRREDHPKFLRRDPVDLGISIVDTENVQLWQNAVVPPPPKTRIPVIALICALYFDSDMSGGRASISPIDFMREFNFTNEHYTAFFDDDPASAGHVALLASFPGMAWERVAPMNSTAGTVTPTAPVAGAPVPGVSKPAKPHIDPTLLPIIAPPIAPPAGGHWWAAEQAVQGALRAAGWDVIDRSRQWVGFDFEAKRGTSLLYIEVKSSAGPCSPVLTNREFEAAKLYPSKFILAIVENFDPDGPVRILWVINPGAIPMVARTVTEYPLPRGLWLPKAEPSLQA